MSSKSIEKYSKELNQLESQLSRLIGKAEGLQKQLQEPLGTFQIEQLTKQLDELNIAIGSVTKNRDSISEVMGIKQATRDFDSLVKTINTVIERKKDLLTALSSTNPRGW
jgi:prefoldin subunit 5